MKKVFLYLYPIKEFANTSFFGNEYYDRKNYKRPFDILNEAIGKRYRENGYQVVYAIYPDKEIFGSIPHVEDKIIFTDITFKEASGYYEDGTEKPLEEIRYPNEQYLIDQLGDVDELIIGGYHVQSCVKRVGEVALNNNINTLVDLDMTELFFYLHKQSDYFIIDSYSPERFKNYIFEQFKEYDRKYEENIFNRNYASPVYGLGLNNLASNKKR